MAMRSAGKKGSGTALVRHVGRRSGQTYQTPIVVARHDDSFLIALPYGERTEWLRNVLAKGSAAIVIDGRTYEVDKPEVIAMSDVTGYFPPSAQRMHRLFGVDSALRLSRTDSQLHI
jgi:deazaflavin-dependent oxidoreductase (nitroreductase family)